MFDANCLRRVANWSSLEKEHKFDKESFNPKKMLEDLPLASPKLLALLNNIKEQDEQDMRQHGKTFKHFIFSEVKAGGYGGRVIVGGLIASGFQLCYDEKLRMKDSAQLLANSGNTFGFLCSTTVYEQPLGVGVKKEMLQTFNSRPSNIHGEIIRIMVADGGFKEGIDLFDVKYVHIFEPQTSEADMKQAVGRATRKCGQSGLQFQPNVGWTLHVYVYDVAIPERLKGNLQDAETLFDLYLKNTNIDLKKITFAKQLEQAVIFGAVDYPLNKNIIDLRGDVVGLSGGLNRNGKKPIPPKLGNEVICNQSCSINRPSKYVPVSIPLFASVAIVVHAPLPPKKMKKPRTHFCDLLKTNKAFCTTVQKAFLDQRGFIKRHANTLLDAIENGVHNQMNYSTRANVLKYIYSFANSSIQQKMVQSPNVKRMLIADRRISMRPDATNGGVPNAQLNTNINNGNVVESPSDALERPRSRGGVNSKNTNADANANAIVKANAVRNANSLQTRSNSQKTNSKNSMLEVEQQDEYANVVPRKTSRRHTTPNATNQDTVLEELATIPLFSLKAPFKETRDYIVDTYASFAWPKVELENMCAPKTGGNIINRLARASVMLPLDPPEDEPISAANALLKEMEAQVKESDENQLKALNNGVNKSIVATFTPTQEFVRHYLTPQNPYKGMLLYHSVGTGKTCTAIATATSSFEKEGWTILWVTRTTLKDDIWKNMFDTVCSLSIKEKLEKGTKIPQNLTDKLKLLPKNWSIRPMSYKQFTNLVAGNNKSLEDLIKKNGAEDPLRKTLLIIDEAHKLYGGSDLLPAEKPDMRKLKAALHKSYTLSGKESVKLLLMSATPYTNDPMELIKLVNLMKEPEEQLPTDFDEFNQVFLDENTGAFTAEGKELFLEKVNGMISFLDRGNDAREFAQPVVSLVAVPLSQRPVADLMALKEEHDKSVASLKHIIKQLDDSFMIFKNTKLEQVKDEIKEVCGNLKGQQYLDCKTKSTPYVQVLLNSIDDMATRINEIKTTHSTEIKKIMTDFNRLKEINENNISQEHIITSKCISTK